MISLPRKLSWGLCLAFLLPLLRLTTAAPIASAKGSSITVKVPASKASPDFPYHRGLAAYAIAMRKHGASKDLVDKLSALAVKHGPKSHTFENSGQSKDKSAGSGSIGPLSAVPSSWDKEYNTAVTIGDQDFLLDFDTGSSDLWVFGRKAHGVLPNQTVYVPSSSASLLPGEMFYIQYGDGSASEGSVYSDSLTIGGTTVQKQAIEVAAGSTGDFYQSDGLVGLGFDVLNSVEPTRQTTLFTNLISSNLISLPVLSADLRHDQVGCYTFGAVPSSSYTGSLIYTFVNATQGYWAFNPTGYAVGSNATTNQTSAAVQALFGIADTGSSIIMIDDDIAAAYWSGVASAQLSSQMMGYIFDCGETLSEFRVQVEGLEVVVPGEYLNYAPNGDGSCYGGLQPTLGQVPFNIFGDVFLKSAFVVFDRGADGMGPRIGFAAKS